MLFVIIAMSVWDLKNGVSVSLWVDKANNDTGVYQAAGMTTTPGTVSKSGNPVLLSPNPILMYNGGE